jgi:hypothetical protein
MWWVAFGIGRRQASVLTANAELALIAKGLTHRPPRKGVMEMAQARRYSDVPAAVC